MPFENPKKKTHKCHLNEGQSKDFKNIFTMNKRLGFVKDRCIARVFDQIVDPFFFGDTCIHLGCLEDT